MKTLVGGQEVETKSEYLESTKCILNLTVETLKESWEILPLLHWTSNYGIEPDNINEHWKRQSELQCAMLRNWRYVDDADMLVEPEALQTEKAFYQFMNNEKEFLSSFQNSLQAHVVVRANDSVDDDVLQLLLYVNEALAAVAARLSIATRILNCVPASVAVNESEKVEEQHLTA